MCYIFTDGVQNPRCGPTHSRCLVNGNSRLLFLQYPGSRLFQNKPHTQYQKQSPSSNFASSELCDFSTVASPLCASVLFPYLYNERVQGDDNLLPALSVRSAVILNEFQPLCIRPDIVSYFPARAERTPNRSVSMEPGPNEWLPMTRLSWLRDHKKFPT